MKYNYAIVCIPGKSYKNAISSRHEDIDVEKAEFQHQKYCKILEKIGLTLIKLPANEDFPDSCFVQDPCVIFGSTAILTKQKEDTRNGEGKEIEKAIKHFKKIEIMNSKGVMDGGDVIVTPKKVFIGLSKRTNLEGVNQYKRFLGEKALPEVVSFPVVNCLHLTTGTSYIDKNTILLSEEIDRKYFQDFNIIDVPKEEKYAANCLSIDNFMLVPAGYPFVKKKIKELGYEVVEVEMSEFKKADGSITCLSLLF